MFIFQKIWRALFSWNTCFEIHLSALLPTPYRIIADIFYPTFILTITVLVYFIRKKIVWWVSNPHLHQGIILDPLGDLHLPPDSQLQSLLAWPKTDVPVFFLYYPLAIYIFWFLTVLLLYIFFLLWIYNTPPGRFLNFLKL